MKRSPIENCVLTIAAAALLLLIAPPRAFAADAVTVNLTLKDHRFQPSEPHAPAGKDIVIVLKNLDPVPAEFESNMLRVEKVVTGGGTVTIRVRALQPGRYRFFDDFKPETEGYLVVQ